ncbi:MAG: hypothetical protein QOE92_1999 [Chloroflexota bacterium]|jgi:hypothetical protein|nr:hypothetical protein [Chloroflexota bacterium]
MRETDESVSPRPATRRQFLGAVGLTSVGGAALASGVFAPALVEAADGRLRLPNAAAIRDYTNSHFSLDLEGTNAGFIDDVSGGSAYGEVITEQLGADRIARKHIGAVHYEPFTLSFGTAMSQNAYDWISGTLNRKNPRHSGAVVSSDFDFNVQSNVSFLNALLTEVTFPAVDGGSKDSAKMTIKFAPESTKADPVAKGTAQSGKFTTKGQKKWTANNFRLTIGGLDTSKVNHVDAITVKQVVSDPGLGELRDFQKQDARLDIPNIVVTMSEASAADWFAWHQDFVVRGNNRPENEKSGTLEYLAADQKETLFTLDLKNLGIFRLAPEKAQAGQESIRRVRAEMYCEEISFSQKTASA